MDTEEISLFDEAFESTIKPRRWNLLPMVIKVLTIIGLIFSLFMAVCTFALIPMLSDELGNNLDQGLMLTLLWIIALVFTLPIVSIHLVVILEWKWAIRLNWVGIPFIGLIATSMWYSAQGIPGAILGLTMCAFYIPYFLQLFKIRRQWEQEAVSRWTKQG